MSDYLNVKEVKGIDPALAAPSAASLFFEEKYKNSEKRQPLPQHRTRRQWRQLHRKLLAESAIYKAIENIDEGSILRVVGKTEYYNDRFSPRLESAEQIDLEEAEAEGWPDNSSKRLPRPKKNFGRPSKTPSLQSSTPN